MNASETTIRTLGNSFHGTEVKVRVPAEWDWMTPGEVYDQLYAMGANGDEAAERKARRIRRTLCGIKECRCGTVR